MTLADRTRPELVIPSLRGSDAASVIQELSLVMHRAGAIPDLLPFYHKAFNRELTVSSVLEAGIALPHARVAAVNEPIYSLGRSMRPMPWGAPAGHSVRLVFLIAIPEGDSTRYLHLVSALARLAGTPSLVEQILTAENAMAMLDSLESISVPGTVAPPPMH